MLSFVQGSSEPRVELPARGSRFRGGAAVPTSRSQVVPGGSLPRAAADARMCPTAVLAVCR
jgi:hypothetical protein